MEFKPNKTEELLALLKNTQPQSVASPLSVFDLMEIQSKQLSKDPVIANLQKFGRGVQGLLEPETPLDYLDYLIAGGAIKGAKVIGNVGKEVIEKASVPKSVFHGSAPQAKRYTEIKSANFQSNTPNQRLQSAIFTTADKTLARKYGNWDDRNVYEIDLSDVSKLKNLLNIGKNQVLNTSKPSEKIVANLDKKIKELSVGDNSNMIVTGKHLINLFHIHIYHPNFHIF